MIVSARPGPEATQRPRSAHNGPKFSAGAVVPGCRAGQHRDQHHVGLAEHADGLDRDQFRVPGPDAHPDQPLRHDVTSAAIPQAAVNLAAAAG